MKAKKRSGSALITVLVLITVFIAITNGMIFLHKVNTRLTKNYLEEAQAMYLADGGLALAETVLQQSPSQRAPLEGKLNTGTYQVVFKEDRERLEGQRLILPVEATGQSGASKQTLVESFTLEPYPRHKAYDYVLFQGDDQVDLNLKTGMDVNGNIFANKDVIVPSDMKIQGAIYAAGHIFYESEGDQVDQVIAPGVSPLDFPDLDLDFYQSIATSNISGPVHVDGDTINEGVFFISGDAFITGNLPPGTAIIASGKLTIKIGLAVSDMVLLIGGESIEIQGSSFLTAALFSPNTISFLGPASITGIVTAKKVICHANTQLHYLNPDRQNLPAPLPGLKITRFDWYQKFFVPVLD